MTDEELARVVVRVIDVLWHEHTKFSDLLKFVFLERPVSRTQLARVMGKLAKRRVCRYATYGYDEVKGWMLEWGERECNNALYDEDM